MLRDAKLVADKFALGQDGVQLDSRMCRSAGMVLGTLLGASCDSAWCLMPCSPNGDVAWAWPAVLLLRSCSGEWLEHYVAMVSWACV